MTGFRSRGQERSVTGSGAVRDGVRSVRGLGSSSGKGRGQERSVTGSGAGSGTGSGAFSDGVRSGQ